MPGCGVCVSAAAFPMLQGCPTGASPGTGGRTRARHGDRWPEPALLECEGGTAVLRRAGPWVLAHCSSAASPLKPWRSPGAHGGARAPSRPQLHSDPSKLPAFVSLGLFGGSSVLLCLQLCVYLEKDNAIVGEDNENIKCLKFSVSHYFH